MTQINIYTKTANKYRIFTCKSFSIRGFAVQIVRNNPDILVLSFWYGDVPDQMHANNQQWEILSFQQAEQDLEKIRQSSPQNYPFDEYYIHTLADLLEKYDYRTAQNLYFCQCLNTNEYPKENPFSGVRFDKPMPTDISSRLQIDHLPAFLKDEDNPFYHFSDILLYYTGKRVERLFRGDMVKGYILETCRFNNDVTEDDDDKE